MPQTVRAPAELEKPPREAKVMAYTTQLSRQLSQKWVTVRAAGNRECIVHFTGLHYPPPQNPLPTGQVEPMRAAGKAPVKLPPPQLVRAVVSRWH